MQELELLNLAKKAREKAYAPYSKFKVGATILMKDGTIIEGCNVENAAYSLTICAERNALTSMVQRGYKKEDVLEMAIVADTENPCSPCGACRQVMNELLKQDTKIILGNLRDELQITSVKELLPFSFGKEELDK